MREGGGLVAFGKHHIKIAWPSSAYQFFYEPPLLPRLFFSDDPPPPTKDKYINPLKILPFLIFFIMIHQIFLLAHDWSKRITWPNIPQISRALIGSILSSIRVQMDKISIQAYNSSTFSCQTVNFLTSGILLTFLSSQSKNEKSYWQSSDHFE